MRIALVDDEPRQLDILKATLTMALAQLGLDAESVECFTAGDVFLAGMEANQYDIIILDIYMDSLNGVDVARKIRGLDEEVVLAFCTSSNEYASQSYEVDARYYLQKPISIEKVAAMLKRFNLSKIERNRSIRLPDGSRVPLRHIMYTEYLDHSVLFHLKGQAPHAVRASQGEIETLLLSHKGFCVINKGCIVNFEQVQTIAPNTFFMGNGKILSIARRRFKEIEAAYKQFLFEKMDREEMA